MERNAVASHCPIRYARVAVLLRGQAFRGAQYSTVSGRLSSEFGGCSAYADAGEQIEATQSLLDHIIRPLEAAPCHNKVEVVLSECSKAEGCPLIPKIFDILGSSRIRAKKDPM